MVMVLIKVWKLVISYSGPHFRVKQSDVGLESALRVYDNDKDHTDGGLTGYLAYTWADVGCCRTEGSIY